MHRRITVALAATAALGVFAAGLMTTASAAAPKKNEIRIVGGFVFKPGKYVKDTQRFKPAATTVKRGATVKVVNKTKQDPHTITFMQKRFLPKGFEWAGMEPLLVAHGVADPESDDPPAFFKVNNGDGATTDQDAPLEVDTMGTAEQAGDSEFLAPGQGTTLKVTASKGSTLHYFCAIHPWMQGKLKVN